MSLRSLIAGYCLPLDQCAREHREEHFELDDAQIRATVNPPPADDCARNNARCSAQLLENDRVRV